jgi:hypothetical protein
MNSVYRLAVALALISGAFPLAGGAAGPSGRYLVIVDTSRSMRHRSKAMLQTVQELLSSGMEGELSGGETLGLWTFNQDLHTGRFPLQVWAPEEQQAIARRALDFLKAQGFDNQPSLDKVIPALEEVVKGSELITVILISAGDAKMRGTPFDEPINDYYARWYGEQRKGQVPLVTVLRARDGKMTGWSVRPAAGPIEFPPWPPPEAPLARTEPPAPAPAPVPVPAPAPQAVQPQMAPPLILSGKKLLPDKPVAEAGEAPPPKPQPTPSAPSETGRPASELGVQAPVGAAEIRRPEGDPKSEIRNPNLVPDSPRPLRDTETPVASVNTERAANVQKLSDPASVPALKPRDSSIAPSGPSISAPTLSGPPARLVQPASPNPNPNLAPNLNLNLARNLESGRPARIVQPASVSHARPMRLWAGSILAGSCCLAFGLFRLRGARQAPRLSFITRSLDGGSNRPQSSAPLGRDP